MARTNKMGILKQKKQQEKQKKLIGTAGGGEAEIEKKDFTNPKGNTYKRFFRSGKYCCDVTGCREDVDGYRILRKPNGGEASFVLKSDSYGYRKWVKKSRKQR